VTRRHPRRTLPAACLGLALGLSTPGALAQLVLFEYEGSTAGDQFGWSIASAGDVDDDGFDDVVVGAKADGQNGPSSGTVWVLSGKGGTILHEIVGSGPGVRLGYAVSGVGDADGDGHDDFAAGAPRENGALGQAFVYSGATGEVIFSRTGGGGGDGFGTALDGRWDLDGDGARDLIVGADQELAGLVGYVEAYSIVNDATIMTVPGAPIAGAGPGDRFGEAVVGIPDVSGDGLPDVLIGAPGFDAGAADTGAAFLARGATGLLFGTRFGSQPGEQYGFAVAGLDDVSGDGETELVVGAPFHAAALGGTAGRVETVSGGAATPVPWLTWEGQPGDQLGRRLARAGDWDGDLVGDLVAASPTESSLVPNGGAAQVLSGADGETLHAQLGASPDDLLGQAVAGELDLSGDGAVDLLVGANIDPAVRGRPGYALAVSSFDPWTDLGEALAGAGGTPRLEAGNTLVPGTPLVVALEQAAPAAPLVLAAGFETLFVPFKGGTMVPAPALLLDGLATDAGGAAALETVWPDGVPAGTTLVLQAWIVDPTGPAGFTASNGVAGVTP